MESKLITVAEAAERLGVTVRTLYGWMADGRLPRIRLSRRAVRVDVRDLEALVDAARAAGAR